MVLVAGEIRNEAIMCSAGASSCMLRDDSDVKVDANLPVFWCP